MDTYYVDIQATDDTGAGTQLDPFKYSPGMASSSESVVLAAGDSVLFKRGETWRETLTPGSSGSAGSPITYGAYSTGNDPVISNGELIGTWTQDAGNIYWATSTTDTASLVFADGVKQTEYRVEGNIVSYADAGGGKTTVTVAPDHFAVAGNTLTIDGVSDDKYEGAHIIEAPITDSTFVINIPFEAVAPSTKGAWTADPTEMKLNLTEGTWCLSVGEDRVYLWMTGGGDPDTASSPGIEISHGVAATSFSLRVLNKEYLIFENLQLVKGTRSCVDIFGTTGNTVANITLRNCTVQYSGHNKGASNTGWYGIKVTHQTTDGTASIPNIFVDNCTTSETGGHGIFFAGSVLNSTVSNCTVSNAGLFQDDVGSHGISSWSVSSDNANDNILYSGNTVSLTRKKELDSSEGDGLQFDNNTKNSTMDGNISHDNEGTGMYLNFATNCTIKNSVIYSNGSVGMQDNWANGITTGDSGGYSLFNNTIYDNLLSGIRIGTTPASTNSIKNNIISENGVYEINLPFANSDTGFNSDNNCVYHPLGGSFMRWKGADKTWATWLSSSSQDVNSINADPQFVDASSDDFHLEGTTPCKRAGTFVGGGRDFDTKQWHVPPDIGAHRAPGAYNRPKRIIATRMT